MGKGARPGASQPTPTTGPEKPHLPVSQAPWGWDHKENTQLTADRRGQGMRSWLCSKGKADPAHHHRDSQVIQTPPASDPGSPPAPLGPGSLQAAGDGRGCASPRMWGRGSTGVPSCS